MSDDGLGALVEEQAALRRVATLVARGVTPEEVFAAITGEVGRLLPVVSASMAHYEAEGTLAFVASWGRAVDFAPVGSRWRIEGRNLAALVFRTGRPARMDSYADASGAIGIVVRDKGIGSSVGTPVIVEGCLWGVMIASAAGEQLLPPEAEARLTSFTELFASAIANAESRAALVASRARIVAAADEARRRIERDLHDGTQQQLVSLMLQVHAAREALPAELADMRDELHRIAEGVAEVFDRVREISHGIHPTILSDHGLEPALRMLARRSAMPVKLDLHAGRRLPDPVEVAAYYAVSEAVANAAKHARATVVAVELGADDAMVRLAIRDDGVGGADPARGSGLTGLGDRIEALGGTMQITSPPGHGTALLIALPAGPRGDPGPASSATC